MELLVFALYTAGVAIVWAAVSLAPVWAGQGRQAGALVLLDEALAAMPEGAPTADLQQARGLRLAL